ncbi:GIP, partial [Symbiodinium necroappetens]
PEQPYLAEDFAWLEPPLTQTIRELRLKRMTDDGAEEYEPDTEEETETTPWDLTPADVFLTGKAVRSEIKLKNLSPQERELYTHAMEKEWSSWEKFNAVEVLSPDQVAQLPSDVKIIGTRWVHTDKNQKQRLLALHLRGKTGKTKEQVEKEYPLSAKSRLVVQGHQEDPKDIRSDSPTASLLAFNLVCAVAVIQGWEVLASDASTAYLQSQGISRLLILRPPRPPPPGLSPNDLLRAKGSIYGTRDAGRSWWKKLYATLRKHGWRMSSVEAALFILSEGNKLLGILISHVDDLFSAGEGKRYNETLNEMETELHLTVKRGTFRFCGKNILQKGGEIFIDQMDAIEGIDYVLLPTDRRKAMNSPLTESEKTAFRGLIGQMGWVVRQSRPDLMVNVSIAAQSMGAPRVQDVVRLNKAVKMLKDTSSAKWCFRKEGFELSEAIAFTFADSSFANLEGAKSQCGFVTGLTSKEIYGGGPTRIYILEAFSGSIKRVCRSTLAAEANGFLTGTEAAEYVRMLLMELTFPAASIRDLDQHYLKEKVACFTDARSLEQTLNKDAGQPADKRVRILIAQIREMIGENTFQDDAPGYATWVDTSQMLADVLTKEGCDRAPLLTALAEGVWQLEASQAAKEKKLLIQAGRHSRKAAQRRAEVTSAGLLFVASRSEPNTQVDYLSADRFSAPAVVYSFSMAKLDVDRYGVPQYGGEPELYEEYQERAWDLWFGRDGNEQTQAATPIHLRSGLVGTAYAAVRKLDHASLITKGTDGKPNEKGLRLLLQTLRDNIEQEAPVKTNELFFIAFYSPHVWRLQSETMQQYIVRREQDFKRLEEVLAGAKIPDHVRAMMLLAFGGLDPREQLNVLSSVNNEYDFKKIAHALRIQYPTCSGKPVHRRDYLGCGRQQPPPAATAKFRPRPFTTRPPKGKGRGYVLAVQDEPADPEDQEAYVEEEGQEYEDDAYEAHGYSDDEVLENMIQDYEDHADDQELAEAYATILQKRKQAPGGGKGPSQPQSFPFKAKGEVVLDQQAKEQRRNAVKFLKSVTPCSACGKKGHWAGDQECPQASRKTGKGGASPKKKGANKRPSPSAFFVDKTATAHDDEEEADAFMVTVTSEPGSPSPSFGVFGNHFEMDSDDPESFMTLRAENLCQHSSYKGGDEKKYHRSANGHSRQIMCKEPECDKPVIQANRREPARLWAFLVQIALCTLWGRRARSRALFQRVTMVRGEAQEERERELDELRGRRSTEDPLARPAVDDG